MFRAILCPSSGAREYYTDGRCLWFLVLWFSGFGMVWSWRLCVRFAGCCFKAAACNKICNKYHLLHLVGILFPHNNDDARSKSLQIYFKILYQEFRGMFEEIHAKREWKLRKIKWVSSKVFCGSCEIRAGRNSVTVDRWRRNIHDHREVNNTNCGYYGSTYETGRDSKWRVCRGLFPHKQK